MLGGSTVCTYCKGQAVIADEKWWADSVECYCYLRNVQDLLADGKTLYERRFGKSFNGAVIPFGAMVQYHAISTRDQSRLHQFGKKVLPGIFLGYALIARRILERRCSVCRLGRYGKIGCIRNSGSKNQCKRSINTTKERHFHIPSCRWHSKIVRKRPRIPRSHCKAGTICEERRSQWRTSRRTGRSSTDRDKRRSPERLGLFNVTFPIVITMNLEFNSTCRKKKHSTVH